MAILKIVSKQMIAPTYLNADLIKRVTVKDAGRGLFGVEIEMWGEPYGWHIGAMSPGTFEQQTKLAEWIMGGIGLRWPTSDNQLRYVDLDAYGEK